MEKFDIEKLHRDCLEWCKNPVWKTWQDGLILKAYKSVYCIIYKTNDDSGDNVAVITKEMKYAKPNKVCVFAHLIGIDVESYRKEAAEPEKEIETIDAEAHEILIDKGWIWNESLNRWQKGDVRIYHNKGDFFTYKKGDAEKGIASKPWNAILPFSLWADSIELEPENKADQEDPFSELIESLERLKNGILENDRRDKIELLKLAVQMATQYSKKESGMKFGFATETFYKQLCKLAGLNEPQPQTVEAPKPEQRAAEQGKVECTITRMEIVPCNFGGVEFGYAAIDAKGKKYLLSHYGSDEVATAEVLRLAYSTMTSAGAVRLEDLIGRKILVAPSESNALLLPLEFV